MTCAAKADPPGVDAGAALRRRPRELTGER